MASPSLPSVEVTEIFDSAVANLTFEFLDQDLVSLPSSTSLKARQVVVRLDGAILIHYSTNVRVRTRPTLHRSYVGYTSFGADAQGTVNGLTVRSDAVLGVPASQTIAVVAEPGYESTSFLVLPETLSAHLSSHDREAAQLRLRRVEMLQVEQGKAGRLFEWGKRLVETAIEQPALFNDSAERRDAARNDMLETLLETLAASTRVELARRERTRLMQSDIVRAAEQYAMAHSGDRLYVKDLCQAASVGERTLEYAFRAEMGLSPTAYLTRIRLHRVREALVKAGQTPTTVTTEALRWGFWHFGEFAKAYRECFQELPSDTLRRATDP